MTMLMNGKKGLVLGIANDHSIAWGIARALKDAGADLAITYQGDAFKKRVEPLAKQLDASIFAGCDVTDEASRKALFDEIQKKWGRLDFLVHAIAYSNKDELKGQFIHTSLENFHLSLNVSCYSLIALTREALPLMTNGGSVITLTYLGAERVVPNYNVMGVAKAALEASVRYLAVDLGPQNIRVNALSAGPMRTLAGAVIGSARRTYKFVQQESPLRRNMELSDIGGTALYLLSDLSSGVTGETIYVDGGYHAIGVPGLSGDDTAAEG